MTKKIIYLSQVKTIGKIKYHIHDFGEKDCVWYKGIYFVDPTYVKEFVKDATACLQ